MAFNVVLKVLLDFLHHDTALQRSLPDKAEAHAAA
jgi:hypothetical protein